MSRIESKCEVRVGNHDVFSLSELPTKTLLGNDIALCNFFTKVLRTVPTIVIAHTFCASPDTRISYRQCLLIQGYFCAVENYPEKVGLSKYSRYPKRKLGVTMHF